MIIAHITGGLGNQLYQYAFARTTAARLGARLKLDIARAAAQGLRPYRLDRFNLAVEFADAGEIAALRGRAGWAERLRLLPPARRAYVLEPAGWFHPFDPSFLALGDDCYIEGYWQSEKYFAAGAAELRRELTLREPPDADNQELAAEMAAVNAVSVHVRRGDYLTRPTARRKFAECTEDYYRRAMARIRESVEQPRFFLFSDEPGWAREHLSGPDDLRVVDGNGPDRDYLDLWLMSRCRHHIIANSTFSWWAAWLAEHPDKIVIAPRRWFNLSDAGNDQDAADRIPAGWLRL